MKNLLFCVVLACFTLIAKGQSTGEILKQQAGQGVKQGAQTVTESAGEKATDKLLNKLFSKKKKKDANSTTGKNNSSALVDTTGKNLKEDNSGTSASLQTYSKFDFVPGDKVIAFEDFSQDAIGDFPDKWNTNSSGEVVTMSGQSGHWLMINKKGVFVPEYIKSLPDNFTMEFDLIYSGLNLPYLQIMMLSAGSEKDVLSYDVGQRSGANIGIQPILRDKGGIGHIIVYNAGQSIADNQVQFQNNGSSKIKVSIWRQKQRLRVYFDENKVFDLPRAFASDKNYDLLKFETWSDFVSNEKYLIGNLKLAVGAPDTRNKLITEGKFSTTGILFDVNSAKIKPESYGTLKEIADVLKDNSSVHISIIGHTDNDGNPDYNLKLSKERAEAVKNALSSQFGIDASRMSIDGKGASQPVADNKTPEGKAQNRRVEFVKQ